MHLIESYALASGAAIEKCFIKERKIDLPFKKYITFHGWCEKSKYRQYSHWQKVIDNLLSNPGFDYEIVQIGELNDFKYNNVNVNYLGKTNFLSLAFLIKNSELHLGFDSFPVHLASHYDKKIVALYPQYANNTGPFFNKKNDWFALQPDTKMSKPVWFSHKTEARMTSPSDRIDLIKHELVTKLILKLLQI